jgi:arylsulfatase A-like enzyme
MVARRLCASFCVLLVTASCFVSYEPAPPAGATAVGPSVLLITVDTLRADHLGTYGLGVGASPQIDRLASQGVVFERAIAGSSTTAPSHAAILTSRFSREHSIGFLNGYTRLEGVPTLASVFRDAGYSTAAFVSNVVLRRGSGFEMGFDVFDDHFTRQTVDGAIQERRAPETTEAALAWLAQRRDQPFLLWVHYMDPHGPYSPPPEFRGRFHLAGRFARGPLPVLADNSGIGGIPAYQVLGDLRAPGAYQDRYVDEIFYADVSIGRLIDAAEQAAGSRGAVVLLTADHGESFGEGNQYFVHRATTPDVAHVPMILRAPGLAPRRVPDLVHHVDVLPTLLELAGVPAPAQLSGLALGPALRAAAPVPERVVFTDAGSEVSAYTQTGFVRIRGVEAAWLRGANSQRALAPSATRYAWDGRHPWTELGDQAVFAPEIDRYLRSAARMQPADVPANQEIARLRALGYLEGS